MFTKVSRRKFITAAGLLLGGVASGLLFYLQKSKKPERKVAGKISGASSKHGHLIRKALGLQPVSEEETDIVIVGGGIAGLSAARWLSKYSGKNILLLELEENLGGNSSYGKNNITEFPIGAHYLPLPNPEMKDLLDFLEHHGAITGYNEKGAPVFNEYYLCFAPSDRLYINGHWQTGLIPQTGISERDSKEIIRFQSLMQEYRYKKGADGSYAFDIPLDQSSKDEEFLQLDKSSMLEFLQQHQFTSEYLYWYVEYCCRDDFGTKLNETSAWAGVHYFAARRNVSANSEHDTVLTWPEGNGWLTKQLAKEFKGQKRTGALVSKITTKGENVLIEYLDIHTGSLKQIKSSKCVVATPQFINKYICPSDTRAKDSYDAFTYAPWLVANLTVNKLYGGIGAPLSWDNVLYKGKSVGYVHANHQDIALLSDRKVITLYWPLTDTDPVVARSEALKKTHEEWVNDVLNEMEIPHREIRKVTESIDIWLWGHGMIRPVPGFLWSSRRREMAKPVGDKIYFAHSDLSGISIFEEAFYQGIKAAKEVLRDS